MNKPDIEEILKSAYIDSGGSEAGFAADRSDVITQYRKQSAVAAAMEESRRKPTMTDYLREQRDSERSPTDDVLGRFVGQRKDAQ